MKNWRNRLGRVPFCQQETQQIFPFYFDRTVGMTATVLHGVSLKSQTDVQR